MVSPRALISVFCFAPLFRKLPVRVFPDQILAGYVVWLPPPVILLLPTAVAGVRGKLVFLSADGAVVAWLTLAAETAFKPIV